MSLLVTAKDNMKLRLLQNEYPGRGIVIGLNETGTKFVQIYWIMGRSENSQNRRFVRADGIIKTTPVDMAHVANPELIIYNAMRRHGRLHIVSNGNQTDTIFDVLAAGGTFEMALATRRHEPDAPNFTPRISGLLEHNGIQSAFALSIIKQSPLCPEESVHQVFRYKKFAAGIGMCIHTYQKNGEPIPPFEGEPYCVPVPSAINEIAESYFNALNPDFRISVVVKTIDMMTQISDYFLINKHQ
ncbi:inosine monophosphate cyclohydrolase [candidate division KSB1 bacterium]|nr:inosine monophosphate cyclohydrolase [candidate division KSB1 bacterium]